MIENFIEKTQKFLVSLITYIIRRQQWNVNLEIYETNFKGSN